MSVVAFVVERRLVRALVRREARARARTRRPARGRLAVQRARPADGGGWRRARRAALPLPRPVRDAVGERVRRDHAAVRERPVDERPTVLARVRLAQPLGRRHLPARGWRLVGPPGDALPAAAGVAPLRARPIAAARLLAERSGRPTADPAREPDLRPESLSHRRSRLAPRPRHGRRDHRAPHRRLPAAAGDPERRPGALRTADLRRPPREAGGGAAAPPPAQAPPAEPDPPPPHGP